MRWTPQRRHDLKKEFAREAQFEEGDKFENPHRSGTLEITDFAYRFEEDEFVYWFDNSESPMEFGPRTENLVRGWEKIEDDKDSDRAGPDNLKF